MSWANAKKPLNLIRVKCEEDRINLSKMSKMYQWPENVFFVLSCCIFEELTF